MGEERMPMGKLAELTGCNVETVRYYEKAGLMPEPARTAGGHRSYSRSHLKRLYFIRRSRELGFPVAQVRQLLALIDEPDHTCGEIKAITLLQAREVQRKIKDLKRLHTALNEMAVKCAGGNYRLDDCPIVEALFDGFTELEKRAS